MIDNSFLVHGLKSISKEVGILYQTVQLPILNSDPRLVNFGIQACNTTYLEAEKFEGRSGACNHNWYNALAATLGETFERYAPVFYDIKDCIKGNYKSINKTSVHPAEYALFHDEQHKMFKEKKYNIVKFTEDTELSWFPCLDLTNGNETWLPGQFIYLPYKVDKSYITVSNSTGLSSHSNYYKAILSALYECIERDSFVITWMNELVTDKIIIDADIQEYINKMFPPHYQWHFFDITYDLEVPTIFGICFGESEYGKFVSVGSASRATLGQALKKVIQEIGQTIPYFRWLLGERKNWMPNEDLNKLLSFSDHSIYYNKRKDQWHAFDHWVKATPTKKIDFNEESQRADKEEIRNIVNILKDKGYNVLLKDITTVDLRQLGSYSVKVFVPQLIQLSGGYPVYFSGGERLYNVPKKMGFEKKGYHELNKNPHPFP